MDERREGRVVILRPTGLDASILVRMLAELPARGELFLVINFEQVPRPWSEITAVIAAMAGYWKAGGRLAVCGTGPSDPPVIIREFRFHFDSEQEAIAWLSSDPC